MDIIAKDNWDFPELCLDDVVIVDSLYVQTKWNPRTKKYYESLGYKYTGLGTPLTVHIEHLKKYSKESIFVYCPTCHQGREMEMQSINRYGHTRCFSCAGIKNIIGKRFGRLVVADLVDTPIANSGKRRTLWRCLCDCGEEVGVLGTCLTTGNNRSCGCLHYENGLKSGENQFVDKSGEQYGDLIVIKYLRSENNHRVWLCECKCGEEIEITTSALHYRKYPCCDKCYKREMSNIRPSGEDHHCWNPSLNREDRDRRGMTWYKKWAKGVYERDGYKCAHCKQNKNLNAHHLYPYSRYKSLRAVLANGITLCEQCHHDFHMHCGGYGSTVTPKKLYDWMGWGAEKAESLGLIT